MALRSALLAILLLFFLSNMGFGAPLFSWDLSFQAPESPILWGEVEALADDSLHMGVLDMEVVQRAHPLFESPRRMDEELHYFSRQLQEEKNSYALVELEVARQREEQEKKKEARLNRIQEEYEEQIEKKKGSFQERMKEQESLAWEEFEAELQEQKERLFQEAEKKVSSRFAGEEEEYEEYVENLLREYQPLILNLRLKLLVLNLLPEKKEALEEEVQRLEDTFQKKVTLRKEELEGLMEEYRSLVEGQAAAELADFERQRRQELEGVLRLKRRRMELELEDGVERLNRQLQLDLAYERERLVEEEEKRLQELEGVIRGEIRGRILFLEKEIERLEDIKASVYGEMEGEIQEIIAVLAQDQGLDLVLPRSLFHIDALDITSLVVEKLQ